MNYNPVPRLTQTEKDATLKDRDKVVLGRKGRGRKTKHVTDSYRNRYDQIKWD